MTLRQIFVATLTVLSCTLVQPSQAETPRPFQPKFYAFENAFMYSKLDFKQQVALLKKLGYEGVASVSPKGLPEKINISRQAGIKLHSIYLRGKLSRDSYEYDNPNTLQIIKEMKGTGIVVELAIRGIKNDRQAIIMATELADAARKSELELVLYHHVTYPMETLGQSVQLAKEINRPNVGVSFNLCHFIAVQPDADLLGELAHAKPWLRQASISGADTNTKDWKRLIMPLDKGSFDQAKLIQTLHELDFQGPVGLQCYNIKENPARHLPRSIATWQKLVKSNCK